MFLFILFRCDVVNLNVLIFVFFLNLKRNLKFIHSLGITCSREFTNFPNFCPSTARPFMRKASCFEILSGKSHVVLKFPHGFEHVLSEENSLVNIIMYCEPAISDDSIRTLLFLEADDLCHSI